MRRTIMLLTMMGLTLVLSSTIALAAVKIGTNAAETLRGTDGNDQITGKGGNDRTVGKLGNDTYYYANGFGVDTVNDTGGTDTLSFSRLTAGVNVYLIPEWGEDYNAVYDAADDSTLRVGMSTSTRDSLVENVAGGAGADYIAGGKGDNVLRPGGGATDNLRDWGGYDGSTSFPAIPVSNDTYKSFSANTGTDYVTDYGGTLDIVDLKEYESSEVYVDTIDLNNSGTEESLQLTMPNDTEVIVVGYFINYYSGQEGKIEEIRFADDTISDAQTQDVSAASAREGSGNVTAQDLAAEAK
ncbi:MAG: M10 family metallopeptidase C-terminal domain-containing protein [Rubrobacter sp.]|nr:M10 family metallopeptidase C-terminal domain-containing protein [Rubrobacter sp.]